MSQMGSISGQQQALNDAAAQMLMPGQGQGQMPGGQPCGQQPGGQGEGSGGGNSGGTQYSQNALAGMQRLSADQDAIKQRLEDLQREMQGRTDLTNRMDAIVDDMEKVRDDFAARHFDENTVKRQHSIMQRLLSATRSMEQQEYKEERKSHTGQDVARKAPGPLPEDLGERREKLRQDLQRALEMGYPKAYEEMIKAYFRQLTEGDLSVQGAHQ